MASRSFQAVDLVQLPRLNVAGAIALGTEIITTAEAAGRLPAPIQKGLSRLKDRHAALRAAAVDRLVDPRQPDSEAARQADRTIDDAWGATFAWASGWARLPLASNEEQARKAARLLEALFPDGMKFTQLVYKLEWVESQMRLDRIAADDLESVFEELGGRAFLQALRAAHKAYGAALGLTKPRTTPEAVAELRGPFDAFSNALRLYVVSVTAHADPDDPKTVALADRLLAPLASWEGSPYGGSERPSGDAPPDAPEPPGTDS